VSAAFDAEIFTVMLEDIVRHPRRVAALHLEAAVALAGLMGAALELVRLRAIALQNTSDLEAALHAVHDQVLDVTDAARRLNVSVDWLYSHHAKLPFTVRNGRSLGFSARGITEYLRRGGSR